MAQSGNLVVCGDAGDALGDSHLRGAALRARHGRRASAPTASRRRCAPSISQMLARPARRAPASTASTPAEFTPLRLGPQALQFQRRQRRRLLRDRMSIDDTIRRPRRASPRPSTTYTLPRSAAPPTTGIYDIRGGGAKRTRAAFRRPAVPRRLDLALSARRLPREVRHRRHARHALRQEADRARRSRSPSPA